MIKLRYFVPFLAALAVFGCSGDKTSKTTDTSTSTTGVTTGTEPVDEKPVVPDSLKNAAFEYKGLGNEAIRTYATTLPEQPEQEGTETIRLEKVEDGKATYTIERSGALVRLGTENVELSDAGVTTVGSSVGVITPTLELPADFAVGKEWTVTNELKADSKTIKATAVNKALKEEKIKVPAGEFDCIVVESKMDGNVSGSPIKEENGKTQTTLRAYYAKGIGIVKLEGTTKVPNGKTTKLNIVLKSIA